MGTPARVTTTQTFAIGPGGCSSQDPRASLCGRDCTACWQLEFLAESKFQLLPPQKHGNCEMPSAAGLGIVSPRDCTSHKAHRERYAVFFLKTRETWIDRLITEQKREARFGRCRRARHGARGREGGPCPADSAAVGGPGSLSQGLSFPATCKWVEGLSAEAVSLLLSPAGRGLDGRRQERLSGRPALGHAGGAAPPGHAGDGQHAPPGRWPAPPSEPRESLPWAGGRHPAGKATESRPCAWGAPPWRPPHPKVARCRRRVRRGLLASRAAGGTRAGSTAGLRDPPPPLCPHTTRWPW